MPLFDKSMEELRAAFVANRLAQPDRFGFQNPGPWFRSQEGFATPSLQDKHWDVVVKREPSLSELGGPGRLREVISPLKASPGRTELGGFLVQDRNGRRFLSFLKALRSSPDAKVYYGRERVIVVATDDHGQTYYSHFWSQNMRQESYGDQAWVSWNYNDVGTALLDAMMAEWLYHRPRWEKARAWLVAFAEKLVVKMAAEAEQDFDNAVAVSSDGIKIVSAEYVAVTSPGSTSLWLYPGSAFRDHKILRNSDPFHSRPCVNRETDGHPSTPFSQRLMAYLQSWRKPDFDRAGHVLIEWREPRHTLRKTIFLTSSRYCPEPLPEGGELVEE